ncbi:DUF6082 family protein [Kineosporia sp. R_H_3]|uniref:DUF6082 family protein n=1 Tax=Kineosporia sp. R_H_3 TaxID=1961848 RepID=UPI001E464961|nr:DUF6082 family protein [Kineosporia sp. R_H_3]
MLAGLGIVTLASPLVLAAMARASTDWELLSLVGQAYGGVSAVASSFALVAVGSSFWLQRRQHRMEAISTLRDFQFRGYDLVRSDPLTYGPVLGFGAWLDPVHVRRHTLYVQHMQYLAATYEMGLVSEKGLRSDALANMFAFSTGRLFWEGASPHWHVAYPNPQTQRFIRIADKALENAIADVPPIDADSLAHPLGELQEQAVDTPAGEEAGPTGSGAR